ncbi:PAS domain-containing sensor histidine kinase [Caballeronia concitans]|jgi:PAS domain S-box-containing protein|uniref:histidine kinase n=1 Tax=Caballeronia concitans TaxID=1777133 RepID=A0A658QUT1_9BURK|nr:PAS domain-containing sensor histidine kinase [Caballeronia concitans]KIG07559.1 PAS/PAC sensor signal transduction histidine kinase [Burkholderia sp. MR1]SAL23239.1 PAS/PAC sensor signal transduction histidine kinase [Caballeronia concitans]
MTPDEPTLSSPLQTDAHFRLLVETVEDYAIFLLDARGHVATWNNGAQRIKGYDACEIVGRHFSVFYPREDVETGKPQHELDAAARAGRIEDEGWRVRKDGTRFWANVVVTALHDANGKLIGFAKVTRDLTDRLRLAELQHARDLSAHVQAALENERASIARELHDDLGQQLAALKMQIATLGNAAARPPRADIQPIEAQIDTIIASVRRIAAGLRPPVLDDLGLFAAIEWLVNDFRRRYGIEIALVIEGEEIEFGAAASTSVFRLVQEALTNVARHAEASEVRIVIGCTAAHCTLRIEDNGRGATLGKRDPSAFGLLGMGERVRQLGGVIVFHSRPGEGFRIDVTLPLSAMMSDGRA